MRTRRQGWAAVVVFVVTLGLLLLDLTDGGFRRWWEGRALTTDVVSGLLELLVTVLIIDQVVRVRQAKDRSQATAAQAAILMSQAIRTSKAVSSALVASGDRDAASDEVRTYMTMLLIAAPVLIDAAVPRNFLEQAQLLGGELARALTAMARTPEAMVSAATRIDEAVARVRAASTPLLRLLNLDQQTAVAGPESTGSTASAVPAPPGAVGAE